MKSSEEFVPNERLRHARSLKGWSQADLAEQVGTSFEVVSRWERGVTVPSPYYRERLCKVLGQSAEDLGLLRGRPDALTSLPSPLVFLTSSHVDADKPIVSHLKTALQERGIALLSSRQISRQGKGKTRTSLREFVQAAQVILVIISPAAGSSRHVREALELASRYQRPVCGVWIEGERWQEYLLKGTGEVAALIDARTSDGPVMIEEIATSLERVGWSAPENGRHASIDSEGQGTGSELATSSQELQIVSPTSQHTLEPSTAATKFPADVPLLPLPPRKRRSSSLSRRRTWMLIGLVVLVTAGTILGSVSLLTHFGMIGTHSVTPTPVVQGGTWTADLIGDPGPFIPNMAAPQIDGALYLPLFYGDGQGIIHPAAATEVPTVQNGGISPDATTWTFHLRPHLVWTDGAPYDARDVDFTWKIWRSSAFGGYWLMPPQIIKSADVSADHLSITFHLSQAYAPFLSYWVDGFSAPLPAHHFMGVPPDKIATSDPTITSGPFMIEESVPGDHYTLVRNPRYYLAREGLPYLDKVVFRDASQDTLLKDLQAGTIDSVRFINFNNLPLYQRLNKYMIVTPPASTTFEAMYFDFHNTILASHPEVRQAMALAIDHQALIKALPGPIAFPLCTDHSTAYHPGFDPNAPCPVFDPAAANRLLEDNGWVKGPDGVRTKNGQRLEFEYSTAVDHLQWRLRTEPIIQRNLQAIGIKLDIQNYPNDVFWGTVVPGGKASPPSGAVAGRYDIGEGADGFGYDPDDSTLLSCTQFTPKGRNYGFYCNPTLDALYQQELTAVDAGARQAIFRQLHQFYLTQFPFITLYSLLGSFAMVRKGTHNYQISPFFDEFNNIWEWWCDNGKC
jgi:peptide/nickel transport system substrate-binding protein